MPQPKCEAKQEDTNHDGVIGNNQMNETDNTDTLVVVALYKFTTIPSTELSQLQTSIYKLCHERQATGCLILASEGINGTVCMPQRYGTTFVKDLTKLYPQYFGMDKNKDGALPWRTRISPPIKSDETIFARLKVKVKEEIVTMGDASSILPETSHENVANTRNSRTAVTPQGVGTYVPPSEWNELLGRAATGEVLVIDTRNTYEHDIGTFENSVLPEIENFTEFPKWFMDHYAKNDNDAAEQTKPRPKSVAMFCTGGIRCEKATAFVKTMGCFDQVYHLEGGILAYLDHMKDANGGKTRDANSDAPIAEKEEDNTASSSSPPVSTGSQEDSNLWKGECFVFDKRVAVGRGLKPSESYKSCFACRRPVSLSTIDNASGIAHEEHDTNDIHGSIENKATKKSLESGNRHDPSSSPNGASDDRDASRSRQELFREGLYCPRCVHTITPKQLKRFEERQRQVQLAGQTNGESASSHIYDAKARQYQLGQDCKE